MTAKMMTDGASMVACGRFEFKAGAVKSVNRSRMEAARLVGEWMMLDERLRVIMSVEGELFDTCWRRRVLGPLTLAGAVVPPPYRMDKISADEDAEVDTSGDWALTMHLADENVRRAVYEELATWGW